MQTYGQEFTRGSGKRIKIVSALDAVKLIHAGNTIATAGFVGNGNGSTQFWRYRHRPGRAYCRA